MFMKWAPVQNIHDEILIEGRVAINDTCVISNTMYTWDIKFGPRLQNTSLYFAKINL